MPPIDLFVPEPPPASLLPVEFDFGAASAAASALLAAAGSVDRAASMRANEARSAEVNWAGAQRLSFDHNEDSLSQDASQVVSELRRLAHQLQHAAESARAEDQRRARGLESWNAAQKKAREAYDKALAARAAS